jgi:hypothetical protein
MGGEAALLKSAMVRVLMGHAANVITGLCAILLPLTGQRDAWTARFGSSAAATSCERFRFRRCCWSWWESGQPLAWLAWSTREASRSPPVIMRPQPAMAFARPLDNLTGDFNGDGRSDVLWRHDSGLVTTPSIRSGRCNKSGKASGLFTVGDDGLGARLIQIRASSRRGVTMICGRPGSPPCPATAGTRGAFFLHGAHPHSSYQAVGSPHGPVGRVPELCRAVCTDGQGKLYPGRQAAVATLGAGLGRIDPGP